MGELVEDDVTLRSGVTLALRRAKGESPELRPFLLVHGLASNARLWDAVGSRLSDAGHDVVAVDLRGHGRSAAPDSGYDTTTCADDLADLCTELDLTADRRPVVAGQSWGGNVVLSLAARHASAAAVALVDGGWICLADRFATFEECWKALAPPTFGHVTMTELAHNIRNRHPDWPVESQAGVLANFTQTPDGEVRARLSREHHRSILHSLWADDPRQLYPLVDVPVLLMPAVTEHDARPEVAAALQRLPSSRVEWYSGADHDLHAQQPDRVAADLLSLAAEAPPL